MLLPEMIEIENVHGICNARCIMCSIQQSQLPKHIMKTADFVILLDKFVPYLDSIKSLDIVGLGESLLDNELSDKIRISKNKGFSNVSIATNANIMDSELSHKLLESKLDIIIFSVDSLSCDTYSRIRKGLDLNKTLGNIEYFINTRNIHRYSTKVYVRIITQDSNCSEWEQFTSYWDRHLDIENGDMILHFPAHNWADSLHEIEKDIRCQYIFDRIVINSVGNVQFCCIDIDSTFYPLGNAYDLDPIAIYNNSVFINARKLMTENKINQLSKCKFCDVPIKRLKRGYFKKTHEKECRDQ